jgi:O-antigen/teichoic acid export membrane protein
LSEKKAVKAGIGYTIGNILVKGINFLTLPLFSRIMTQEQFGVYNVFLSYDSILFVVVGLALHSSVRSAHYEFRGKTDEYVSSISLIYLLNTAFFLLVVFFFGNYLSGWMGYSKTLLYLLVLFSFGGAMLSLYNNRLSLDYSYKKYMCVSLVNSLGNVSLSLLLIFTTFQKNRDIGRILGATLTLFVIAVVLLISMYRKALPRYNKEYWRFGLKYSLPIVPHGISQVILSQFDRIMIKSMVGDAEAGIFSLAANIQLILTVISDSVFTAWSTWFYEEIDQNHTKAIQKRATQITVLFTILAVGLIALSPEIIFILGGTRYELGKYVAIPMVLDAYALFLYGIIVPSEYYTKKTQYIMFGTIAAAAINIAANLFFIGKFGFLAAAYCTLFAYICYLLFHILISRKLVKFSVIPIKNILFNSLFVVLMAVMGLLLVDSILIRYAICAIIVIPMAWWLLKDSGVAEKYLKREKQ